ncbi:hypothetical protein [Streptomyces sp. NPDC058294]|uniref:hypothetical protein n=1 Tax=Streptomyces sp. NPDC058294 TaxID=3346430 RepID=UPI0036E02D0A
MTAEHEGADGVRGAEGAGEYGGMDALMAAITGDPLPEEAHRDPAFRTRHRAAEADVALLRDRLHRLAEALTGERTSGGPGAGGAVAGEEEGRSAGAGEPSAGDVDAGNTRTGDAGTGGAARSAGAGAGAGAGDLVAGDAGDVEARPAGAGDLVARDAGAGEPMAGDAGARSAGAGAGAGAGGAGGAVAGGGVARRARGRTGPPRRPGRRSRRALRIGLGSLAGAAAFSLILGLGWLVTRAGGGAAEDSGGASESAADSAGKAAGDGGRPADAERELACSRLVVEGTVAKVRRLPNSPASRITLTVLRSYKPAHGPAEVGLLLDGGTRPAPRTGQHVLVRVGRGEEQGSVWAVGDSQVATARVWITDALPGSRHLPCS